MSQLNVIIMYLIFEETIGNLISNIIMKKPQKVVCEYVGHRSTYIEHYYRDHESQKDALINEYVKQWTPYIVHQ